MLVLLFACHADPPSPPALHGVSATEAPPPVASSDAPAASLPRLVGEPQPPGADGVAVLAALERGGARQALHWRPLLIQGRAHGGPPFGTVLRPDGTVLGEEGACDAPDFNGWIARGDEAILLTHLECAPGALVKSRLRKGEDGFPRVEWSAPVDVAAIGGLSQPCAGQVTPWGSLLSGEEFETDAALWVEGRIPSKPVGLAEGHRFVDNSRYAQWSAGTQPAGATTARSPYGNGWMVETALDAAGETRLQRRYALGRFSHELAVVAPDQRTVYLSDDTSHGLLGLFVADAPGDLRAGRLYAASLSGEGPVRWVPLGHIAEDEVERALREGVRFEQLFTREAGVPEGGCREGLRAVRSPPAIDECLAPIPGKEALASRLETRRMAAVRGATVELVKAEGLALDAEGRRLFLATTRLDRAMRAGDPPWPEADRLRLDSNPCGAIWAFSLGSDARDTEDQPIDSGWVARETHIALAGRPVEGGCAEDGISEPDSLAWSPELQTLFIGEDTDRSPNRLWAWQEDRLVAVLAAPAGPSAGRLAEVSGLAWVPDGSGQAWLTVSIQHPGGQPAMAGVLGPFPR